MDSQSETSVDYRETNDSLAKSISFEWLGQTIASICWVCSVFAYGINSAGDWLQLIAGLSWLFANISSLNKAQDKQ